MNLDTGQNANGFPRPHSSRVSIRRKPVGSPTPSSTSSLSNLRTPSLDSRSGSVYEGLSDEDNFEFLSEPQDAAPEGEPCSWCDNDSDDKRVVGKWYCSGCGGDWFCDDHWGEVPRHRKNAAGHEKVARSKQEFYQNLFDGQTFNSNAHHVKDMAALWFAVDHADSSDKSLEFEEYPRFSQLVSEHRAEYPSVGEIYPRLVSFVGSTGAGKSTLIRLLMERRWRFKDDCVPRPHSISKPINGDRHKSVPTSGDVHLYRDPYPDDDEVTRPLFFADCEGIDGGAMRPTATKLRQKCSNPEFAARSDLGGIGYQLIRRSVSRNIQYDTSGKVIAVDKRQYSVEKLYPRLLYNFSEVVVHLIPGQTKTLEKNINHILQWAHASDGSATNRLSRPHLIVVINQAPDDSVWDHREATAKLLKEQSQSLVDGHAARFRRLQSNPERISTMEDLLLCYYSGVDFIFIPNSQGGRNLHLFENQLKTLFRLIDAASQESQERKEESRVLLSSKGQEMLIKLAFEHYTMDIDRPFDFIKQYFSLYPIAYDLAGNFLRLLQEIQEATKNEWLPRTYLEQVVPVLVTSVALDAVRAYPDFPGNLMDILSGTGDSLSDKTDAFDDKPPHESYLSLIRTAVKEFCDRFVRCDYVDELGSRCVNNKLSHLTHQGDKGQSLRIFGSRGGGEAIGDFHSKFATEFLAGLDSTVNESIQFIDSELAPASGLASPVSSGSSLSFGAASRRFSVPATGPEKSQRMWQIHMVSRSMLARSVPSPIWRELPVCSHCLKGESVEILPCDHGICVECIQASGFAWQRDPRALLIYKCDLHSQSIPFNPPFTAHLKPSFCSPRVLTIDGGGVRGVVGLKLLAAIEERMGGEIPIQRFFDLIAGTSAGAFAAIGTGIKDMRVKDLIQQFQCCCKDGFSTTRMPVIIRGLRPRFKLACTTPHSMDRAVKKILDDSAMYRMLQSRSPTASLFTPRPKVFVTVYSVGTGGIVPNYIRPNREAGNECGQRYRFLAPKEPKEQLLVWEAARASSAAPTYFPPFLHTGTREYLYDGGLFANNPAALALEESLKIWPNRRQVDILLSIGNGKCTQKPKLNTLTPLCETLNTLAALKNVLLKNIESEKIWQDHFSHRQHSSPFGSSRYTRMNLMIDGQIKLDDINAFDKLVRETERYLSTREAELLMDSVIHRLIATSFYLEPSRIETQRNGMLHLIGKIKCRFLNTTPELRDLYNLLGKTFRRNPFWFELCESHDTWVLTPEILHRMRDEGTFEVDVRLSLDGRKDLDIVLVSKGFDAQSISGCPLKVREKAQADLVSEFARFKH